MKTTIVLFVSLCIISVFLFTGCDQSNNVSPKNQITYYVSPPDGAANVDASTQVIIEFSKPVTTTVVERNFHLISEHDMADSLCPVSSNMHHGVMDSAMMNQSTMHHLIDQHSSHGTFIWNDAKTKCMFKSDSVLTPNTLYMVHIAKEMMNTMNYPGMGNCNCPGMQTSDVMYHFRTRNL